MTITDERLIMSDAQTLAIAVGTANSTNVVDLGAQVDYYGTSVDPDVGAGGDVWAHVKVGTAATCAATTGTLLATVEDSADNSSFSPIITSSALIVGDLGAGTEVINIPMPKDVRRYVKIEYTVGTADLTGGTIDAWIDLNAS